MPTLAEHTDIKKQLEMLKVNLVFFVLTVCKSTLEYDTHDNELDSVENILKTKNRKLETELMRLKATLTETTTERNTFSERIAQLEKAEADYKLAITKLEEDIAKGYNKSTELFSVSLIFLLLYNL
jgi:chromosome segregation ATPase